MGRRGFTARTTARTALARVTIMFAAIMFAHSAFGQGTAGADTIRNFKVGSWNAGAYSFKNSRDFSHCAASASYRSGILMLFSITRDYQWALAFANKAWRLTPGSNFPISFSIDGGQPLRATAQARLNDMVTVPLAESVELFNQFRRGRVLRVDAASQTFEFNLDGTAQLLTVLHDCVRTKGAPQTQQVADPFAAPKDAPARTARSPQAATDPFSAPKGAPARTARAPQADADPFAGSSRTARAPQADADPFAGSSRTAPAPASRDSNPAHQAEATATLSNVLSAAGIRNFTVHAGDERPSLKADAFWVVNENLLGAIRVMPTASPANVQDIQSSVIGDDAQSCKGSFASGAIPEKQSDFMLRIFTACETGGESVTIYYLAIKRPRGGLYMFTTLSAGTDALARDTDASLRSAALRVVR